MHGQNHIKPKLKSTLTTICAFSSHKAFKGPTLEDDICSNLLNSGTRGALVPDDTTLKKRNARLQTTQSYLIICQRCELV